MGTVPRHLFVPEALRHLAYADQALSIGYGQTISQPLVVALMTQALELKGDEKVLEVGTGSGYQAAVLSLLARHVYTIERLPELAEEATRRFRELGYSNITVRVGDGSLGLPEHAPYEGIILTAAAPDIPEPLWEQLADGGRLVAPVGSLAAQQLVCIRREGNEQVTEMLGPVAFVPLIGQYGWESRENAYRDF